MLRTFLCLATGCCLFSSLPAVANDAHRHAEHHAHEAPPKPAYIRSSHDYRLPDVRLSDQDGREIRMAQLLSTDAPLIMNVIYTSCTSICPVMTSVFSSTRRLLGPEAANVRMISITNDPEHDTVEVLRAYARTHRADWPFLTGKQDDIATILRALDADRGGKMNHLPLTFLRASRQSRWVRLEGLTTAQQLIQEHRQQLALH